MSNIDSTKETIPWYVKLLTALSGWMGAFFLTLFFGFLFNKLILDSPIAMSIVGSLLIFTAYRVLSGSIGDFFEHFALALSMTGQVMIIASLLIHGDMSRWLALLAISIFQILLALWIPNYIHRVLTSFFASTTLYYLSVTIHDPYLYIVILTGIVSWMWLQNPKEYNNHERLRALSYGALVSLVSIASFHMFNYYGSIFYTIHYHKLALIEPWMGELISGVILILVSDSIFRRYPNGTISIRLLIVIALSVWSVVSLLAHGVSMGIMIVVLGYINSNRLVTGLGIIALLSNLSVYYYFTEITLLQKSAVLLAMGSTLLIGRYIMHRVVKEESNHG